MSHHTRKAWPAQITIAYLARRAGMSRYAMRRRLLKLPKLAAILEQREEGLTTLTLADIEQLDPRMFRSIAIRDEMALADEAEDDDERGTG